MKCIVLYHEKVADYLLKYDLAEIQKMGDCFYLRLKRFSFTQITNITYINTRKKKQELIRISQAGNFFVTVSGRGNNPRTFILRLKSK
jgi:hypothetical protein